MDTVQIVEISSRECKKYLSEGGDLAIVPIGSVERLGPHLPLAAKNYIVYAVAEQVARRNKGYCLPVIPFSTVYDTHEQAGSVSTDSKVLTDYAYDVCKELVANGFRRIVFVSYFHELYYVANEFFQQEDIPPAWVNPDDIRIPEAKDRDTYFTSLTAACLKLCGKDELLERLLEENSKKYGKYTRPAALSGSLGNLRNIGRIGYHFKKDEYEILPVEKVLVDEAISAIQKWVEDNVPTLQALGEYAYFLSRARFDRGLR